MRAHLMVEDDYQRDFLGTLKTKRYRFRIDTPAGIINTEPLTGDLRKAMFAYMGEVFRVMSKALIP